MDNAEYKALAVYEIHTMKERNERLKLQQIKLLILLRVLIFLIHNSNFVNGEKSDNQTQSDTDHVFGPTKDASSVQQKRFKWSSNEDAELSRIAPVHGIHNLKKIAKILGSKFGKLYTSNKIRERWNNHLNPLRRKGKWALGEDLALLRLYVEIGNKWSVIAQKLYGRTDHDVKNRITRHEHLGQKK